MNEPQLHAFDHALCDHAIEITRTVATANPQFGRMIAADLPELAEEDLKPDLLLSEWDLQPFEVAAAFARVRDPWVPDVFLYERWMDAIPEIRRDLGDVYVAAWHDYSAAAFDRLLARPRFDVGLEVLREWLQEARQLLRAMGRVDLVPRPSGGHPTWGMPEPSSPTSRTEQREDVSPAPVSGAEPIPEVLLCDIDQVATLLNTSVRNVYRMKDEGSMPQPRKLRGSNRWSRTEIEDWIEKGCPSCKPARQKR